MSKEAIITATTVAVVLSALIMIWRVIARYTSKAKIANLIQEHLRGSFDSGLQKATQLRLQEETHTDRGECVWFSHHIHDAQMRHWVIVTHDSKFEVCRSRPPYGQPNADVEGGHADTDHWTSVGVGDAQYSFRILPCKIDNQRYDGATTNFTALVPMDGFTPYLLGWTQMSKDEVVAAWMGTLEGFGNYDFLWNNCQHLMRDFASSIIHEKAVGWNLFFVNASISYRKGDGGVNTAPHVAAIALSVEKLKAMRPQVADNSRKAVEDKIKALDDYLRKQRKIWAKSNPIDLADAHGFWLASRCGPHNPGVDFSNGLDLIGSIPPDGSSGGGGLAQGGGGGGAFGG